MEITTGHRALKEQILRRHEDPNYRWHSPADEARELIRQQREKHGLALAALAKASGLSLSVLYRLQTGQTQYVYPKTLEGLRRLPHLGLPHLVPAGGTYRRITMLQAQGWPIKRLREILDSEPNFGRTMATREYAERVIRVVLANIDVAGPSVRAMKRSRAKGYLPASAYDRDVLADVMWDGEGGLLEQQRASSDDVREEYWFLVSMGVDPFEAGTRVDRTRSWVVKEWQASKGITPPSRY